MKEDNLVGRLNVTRENLAPLLKEAREAKGFTVEEIADKLKIRPSLLEQIEAGKYETLPEMIYTRAYIQKFAQIVGLTPEPFVTAYERIAASVSAANAAAKSNKNMVIEQPPIHRPVPMTAPASGINWLLIAGGALLLVGLAVAAFFLTRGPQPRVIATNTAPIETSTMPSQPQTPVVNNLAGTVKLSVGSTPSGATVFLDNYKIGLTPLKQALVSSRAARELRVVKAGFKPYISTRDLLADSNLIVTLEKQVGANITGVNTGKVQLIYRGSSWTRVRDARGTIIYEGVPKPGDRLEFTPPVSVRLGAPSVVSAVVAGQTRERLGGSSPVTIQLP